MSDSARRASPPNSSLSLSDIGGVLRCAASRILRAPDWALGTLDSVTTRRPLATARSIRGGAVRTALEPGLRQIPRHGSDGCKWSACCCLGADRPVRFLRCDFHAGPRPTTAEAEGLAWSGYQEFFSVDAASLDKSFSGSLSAKFHVTVGTLGCQEPSTRQTRFPTGGFSLSAGSLPGWPTGEGNGPLLSYPCYDCANDLPDGRCAACLLDDGDVVDRVASWVMAGGLAGETDLPCPSYRKDETLACNPEPPVLLSPNSDAPRGTSSRGVGVQTW